MDYVKHARVVCCLFTVADKDVMNKLFYVFSVLLGLILPVFLSLDVNTWLWAACLLLAAVGELLVWRRATIAVFLCGCLFSVARMDSLLAMQLPAEFESETLIVEGRVVGIVQEGHPSVRFAMQVDELKTKQGAQIFEPIVGGKIQLLWRSKLLPQTGELWRFDIKAKRPRGMVNPRGFDYQVWLLANGFFARGYVLKAERLKGLDLGHRTMSSRTNNMATTEEAILQSAPQTIQLSVQQSIHELSPVGRDKANERTLGFSGGRDIGTRLGFSMQGVRSNLVIKVNAHAHGLKRPELVKALLLGDKHDVSQDQWDVLQRTGTIHLMAISGLHIGVVAFVVMWLFTVIMRPATLLFQLRYIRLVPLIAGVGAAWFYASLAGFGVPTQRAGLIVFGASVCVAVGRKVNPMYQLALVACLVVAINPFQTTQPGFALSFGAVAALLFAFSCRRSLMGLASSGKSRLIAFIQAQWVVFVGLLLLLSAFGLPTSLLGPLANVIAVPLVSFLVLPLLLLGGLLLLIDVSGAMFIIGIADSLLDVLFSLLGRMSGVYIGFQLPLSSLMAVVITLVMSVLFLLPRQFGFMRVALLLVSVIGMSAGKTTRGLEVDVLDVGQGLSTVIKTHDFTMVYDIGARFSPKFNVATRVLEPYLRSEGITELDLLLISHADNDHAGSFDRFSKRMPALKTITGEPDKLSLPPEAICRQKDLSTTEDFELKLLWPTLDVLTGKPESGGVSANDHSCVVLLSYAGYTVLFTGDIEKAVERRLLESGDLPSNIDVLIAPHHGSTTSSSVRFVQHLRPKHVIYSAGYKNRYHHPSKKVQARYASVGTKQWNTAMHGAVRISISNGQLQVSAQRCEHKRRWHQEEGFCKPR